MAVIGILTAVGFTAAGDASELQMIWHVRKVGDLESSDRSCIVTSFGHDVVARLFREVGEEDPSWSVSIGFNNTPNSLRYLRVNREVHVTDETYFRGSEAKAIVNLLKKPGEFSFEWSRRPSYAKQQGLFGNGDFAEKAAACEDWMGRDRI